MKPAIVGSIFYSVRPSWRKGQPPSIESVRVIKVGRKWATYEPVGRENLRHLVGRFDLESGALDGGDYSSPGRVYDDEGDYHSKTRALALWEELRRLIQYQYAVPNNLDEVGVLKAADALGFKLKGE